MQSWDRCLAGISDKDQRVWGPFSQSVSLRKVRLHTGQASFATFTISS